MREIVGDLWALHAAGAYAVIPINLVTKKDGLAVMGAGLARQASFRFPQLPRLLGDWIQSGRPGGLFTAEPERCICLPTKYHWRDDSDATLITQMLESLRVLHREDAAAIPLLGAGLGRLSPAVSRVMILRAGKDCPKWVLVKDKELDRG